MLSPVVALLLLGLPVVDSLVVFAMRAKRGDSLVVAAKDHLHHRLLKIGFYHYESVMVIYSLQILFAVIAVLLPYESDMLLLGIYLAVSLVLYCGVYWAELSGWKVHEGGGSKEIFLSNILLKNKIVAILPFRFLEGGVLIVVLASALMSTQVPGDIGVSSFMILVLLLLSLFVFSSSWMLQRLLLYITAGTSAYLLYAYPPSWLLLEIHLAYAFYVLMLLSAFFAARLSRDNQFAISPLDYLVIVIAVVVALVPGSQFGASSITWLVIQMIILFYSVELLLQNMSALNNRFVGAVATGLALLVLRAFL